MFAIEAYFTNGMFLSHNSLFVYTFCRLLNLGQKLNMVFYDFHNIQSGERVAAELSS